MCFSCEHSHKCWRLARFQKPHSGFSPTPHSPTCQFILSLRTQSLVNHCMSGRIMKLKGSANLFQCVCTFLNKDSQFRQVCCSALKLFSLLFLIQAKDGPQAYGLSNQRNQRSYPHRCKYLISNPAGSFN